MFRRTNVRIAAAVAFFFALGSMATMAMLYGIFSGLLVRYDHDLVSSRLEEIELATRGKREELGRQFSFSPGDAYMVQLIDPSGKTVYLKWPGDMTKFREREAKYRLLERPAADEWFQLQSPIDEDRIDIFSKRLADGFYLRVGKSSEDREELLEKFFQYFLGATALSLMLGVFVGLSISARALAPLRGLIGTMKKVEAGKLSSRVPLVESGDEMEDLTRIFNEMLDKLEKVMKGMREALDNVAHDIRTPLARIRATGEIRLRGGAGELELKEALEECVESSGEVISLLDTLMDLGEAESGVMRLRREPSNLKDILLDVVDLYEVVADENEVKLTILGEPGIVASVDSRRIRQALANLLDNAIKYSRKGSEVWLSAELDGEAALLSVRDSGMGIDSADLPRVWDRLYRGDKSRSQRGLGLGLSVVKAIASAHGGDARVVSESGSGSTFTIVLPL